MGNHAPEGLEFVAGLVPEAIAPGRQIEVRQGQTANECHGLIPTEFTEPPLQELGLESHFLELPPDLAGDALDRVEVRDQTAGGFMVQTVQVTAEGVFEAGDLELFDAGSLRDFRSEADGKLAHDVSIILTLPTAEHGEDGIRRVEFNLFDEFLHAGPEVDIVAAVERLEVFLLHPSQEFDEVLTAGVHSISSVHSPRGR